MSKIINKKYQISLLISSLLVFGCSFNQIDNIKNNDIYQIKASSKNGAELNFKISLKQNTFNLKANQVGSISKTISDIDHYIVYLIKNSNTSSYPSGGDPIGDAILGPITIPASSSEQIKITGLDNSLGDAYYIAVKAQDSSNNDLIKDNNGDSTPWSGDTASDTLKIAVSDFGAVVNSSLVVSPKANLVVTINLIDEIGNSLGINTSVNNGALIRSTSRILENYITTIAGGAIGGFNGDGDQATSSSTMLDGPQGVAIDSLGNMYISDSDNHRIRKVDTSGIITTIAGSGSATTGALLGDGGQATSARLNSPFGITLDKNNNIYICDGFNNRIRKIDTSGVITTIAGTTSGFSGDGGPATDAQLNQPYGITIDNIGNLYFSDSLNNKVRKIDTSGVITTIAGTTSGFSGDGGPATDAKLRSPRGVFMDKLSNLYISDLTNNLIRKVNKAGIITTIAGNTSALVLGDGGQATAAKLSSPESALIDLSGNLYISDKNNNLIRKVNASGIITTLAGTTSGFSGDGGLASSSKIKTPALLTMDSFGNLYIADKGNNRIRKIYAN